MNKKGFAIFPVLSIIVLVLTGAGTFFLAGKLRDGSLEIRSKAATSQSWWVRGDKVFPNKYENPFTDLPVYGLQNIQTYLSLHKDIESVPDDTFIGLYGVNPYCGQEKKECKIFLDFNVTSCAKFIFDKEYKGDVFIRWKQTDSGVPGDSCGTTYCKMSPSLRIYYRNKGTYKALKKTSVDAWDNEKSTAASDYAYRENKIMLPEPFDEVMLCRGLAGGSMDNWQINSVYVKRDIQTPTPTPTRAPTGVPTEVPTPTTTGIPGSLTGTPTGVVLPDPNFFRTHTYDTAAMNILLADLDSRIFDISSEEAVLRSNKGNTGLLHPWFAGTAVYNMLKVAPNKYSPFAKKWLTWTLNHINDGNTIAQEIESAGNYEGKAYPNCGEDAKIWDGTTFIHEYRITNGQLSATRRAFEDNSHTATDNWNGVILLVASEYYRKTGDANWVKSHIADLRRVAKHYEYLTTHKNDSCSLMPKKSNDTLILRARPDTRIAYSADSMYVYFVLNEYQAMLRTINAGEYGSEADVHLDRANKIFKGIRDYMWHADGGYYDVYIQYKPDLSISRASEFFWNRFYGDAVNNIYPSMWDMGRFSKSEQKTLYNKFLSYHARWAYGHGPISSPWAHIGLAAFNDGDMVTSAMLLENSIDRIRGGENLGVDQSGYLLLLANKLKAANPEDNPKMIIVDDNNSAPDNDGNWTKKPVLKNKVVEETGGSGKSPPLSSGNYYPHFGNSYLTSNKTDSVIRFSAWVPESSTYSVYMIYQPDKSADPNVSVTIQIGTQTIPVSVNQTAVPSHILYHKLGSGSVQRNQTVVVSVRKSSRGQFATVDGIVLVKE